MRRACGTVMRHKPYRDYQEHAEKSVDNFLPGATDRFFLHSRVALRHGGLSPGTWGERGGQAICEAYALALCSRLLGYGRALSGGHRGWIRTSAGYREL